MCNFQVTLTCILTEILSIQPISLQKENFLLYHSTISTLTFRDSLTKVLVKTYSMLVRKNQTCLWQRSANETWTLDFLLWFCFFLMHAPIRTILAYFFRSNLVLPIFLMKWERDKKLEITLFLKYHCPYFEGSIYSSCYFCQRERSSAWFSSLVMKR